MGSPVNSILVSIQLSRFFLKFGQLIFLLKASSRVKKCPVCNINVVHWWKVYILYSMTYSIIMGKITMGKFIVLSLKLLQIIFKIPQPNTSRDKVFTMDYALKVVTVWSSKVMQISALLNDAAFDSDDAVVVFSSLYSAAFVQELFLLLVPYL